MSDSVVDKRMPYYEQCYYTIKNMIFNGKFKPGERINETQLTKDFNVSKSPVREAIRILEKEGLLVVDKSRVLVYEPTVKDIKEVYFCRMALPYFLGYVISQIKYIPRSNPACLLDILVIFADERQKPGKWRFSGLL